jgi:hypothetical protein
VHACQEKYNKRRNLPYHDKGTPTELKRMKTRKSGGSGWDLCSFLPKASSNASRQKPTPLPDDGQQTAMKQQTVMREAYAQTGDSGVGLLHAFVSHCAAINTYFTVNYTIHRNFSFGDVF